MNPEAVITRLERIAALMATKAKKLEEVVQSRSFPMADLASQLDACNKDMAILETLLAPAYAASPGQKRFNSDESSSIALVTANMVYVPMTLLTKTLLDFLYNEAGECRGEVHMSNSGTTSSSSSGPVSRSKNVERQHAFTSMFCVRITTLLTRVLLLAHFTLKHLKADVPNYVGVIHQCEFFSRCSGILSFCTADLQMLSAPNPFYLPVEKDRLQLLLCGAVLGCTLGEYCHAAYGDVRWSSDITQEMTHLGGGSSDPDPRPSKKAVWAKLTQTATPVTLTSLTKLLTTAAQVGTFFPLQTPLYQSLLTPSLGLESLVRAFLRFG